MSRNFREYIAKNLAARIAARDTEFLRLKKFTDSNMCKTCEVNIYLTGGRDKCDRCNRAFCGDCSTVTSIHKLKHIDVGLITVNEEGYIFGEIERQERVCRDCNIHNCSDYKCDMFECTLCLIVRCYKCGKPTNLPRGTFYRIDSKNIRCLKC
jgi:hypothetical protein